MYTSTMSSGQLCPNAYTGVPTTGCGIPEGSLGVTDGDLGGTGGISVTLPLSPAYEQHGVESEVEDKSFKSGTMQAPVLGQHGIERTYGDGIPS